MAWHRPRSVAFTRRVAEQFIAGETLHMLSKRRDAIGRSLDARIAVAALASCWPPTA